MSDLLVYFSMTLSDPNPGFKVTVYLQAGCDCRMMETLSRDRGWKLMTTGGTSKHKCLNIVPLHEKHSYR